MCLIIHPIFDANLLVLLAEILGIDNCSCQNKWGGFNLICTPHRPFCKTQRLGFYDHTCNLSAQLESLLHLNATFLSYSAGSQGYSLRYLCFVFEAINLKHCQSWIFLQQACLSDPSPLAPHLVQNKMQAKGGVLADIHFMEYIVQHSLK